MARPKEIPVRRWFAYKLGRPNFSSVDFGCDVTDYCAREDVAKVGAGLAAFCKVEVQKSIVEFLDGVAEKERTEREAEKRKAEEKSNVTSKSVEEKERANDSAEHDAGDITIEPIN